jgi:phenylacetate-CoA ligase
MSVAMQIYHRMPAWSRSLAASLRGYYLSSWRYDAQTEKLVEEILERDFWSEKQWKEWRENRLTFVLNRAATKVPFYREAWARRRRNGDNSSHEYLENWTILEKQTLRENAAAFVAEDCQRSKMYRDHTSGTTGTSLNLWSNSATVKLWYALFEARSRRWYGVSRRDRWAILGGQMITPVNQKRPPFWVWNAGMNQLYMSSYHLAPDLIGHYLDALTKYRVRYILGYSSALFSLAQIALKQKRRDLQMDVVIANAEPLYDYQREIIAEAFACPVRETYGMAEACAAASECEHGKLHEWSDVGIVEQDGSFSNEPMDFLCTGLVNADMPLIRYRVGDCGIFSGETCSCGRKLPVIKQIEGRNDDVLYTADGRRVGRLDPVFKDNLPVVEAQIIQESLKNIKVLYVPAAEFNQRAAKNLTERIRERMGDVEVNLEKVAQIERTNRGKFRAVICNLSDEERAGLS